MVTSSTRERSPSLAQALGWFSIAVGSVELIAPRAVARLIGAPGDARTLSLLRTMGAREVGHGVSILTIPDSSTPVWSRVAGDAADLAFIGSASHHAGADQRRLMAAAVAIAGVAAVDVLCAQRLSHAAASAAPSHRAHVTKAITVNKPIEEVYGFWRQLENVPKFMRYVESVEQQSDGTSRWTASGPGGTSVQWDAEIIAERENELLAWRSLPGSRVHSRGTITFQPAPGARGTEVHVDMDFQPPAGALGRSLAWASGRSPSQQLQDDLRRLKQLLETGELTLSEGAGLWRPGRPVTKPEQIRTLAGVRS